jgi:acetyltransferase-like isoleucine patch superfamily enzyme
VSHMRAIVERFAGRFKGDATYRLAAELTDRQLAAALWHRGFQLLRGATLPLLATKVCAPVLRGRRVVVEHAYAVSSGPGLILEDGVLLNALSREGIHLGRSVTIGRNASLVCTGVIARLGRGIRIGDRSAVGAGSFLGGQGGLTIGDDVLIGPGTHIFSENHNYADAERPIRTQGESRIGVTIGNDCWIGAGVIIVDGVDIGCGCVIAAGAVVTRSVPAFSVVAGVPARVISSRQSGPTVEASHAAARPPELPRHAASVEHRHPADR